MGDTAPCAAPQQGTATLGISLMILLAFSVGSSPSASGLLYVQIPTGVQAAVFAVVPLAAFVICSGRILLKPLLICVLLFLAIIGVTISLMLSGWEIGLSGAVSAVSVATVPLFSFLLASGRASRHGGKHFSYVFFFVYTLWLSAQVLLLSASLLATADGVDKISMHVGIGGSNYIASHLLVCLVLLLLWPNELGGPAKWTAVAAGSAALVLTASFGALAVLVVVLIPAAVLRGSLSRTARAVGGALVVAVLVLAILFVLGVLPRLVSAVRPALDSVTRKFGLLESGDINRFSSGRQDLLAVSLEAAEASPAFGASRYVEWQGVEFRTHNWILDLLVSRGLFGLMVFGGAVVAVLLLLWKPARRDWWLMVILLALLAGTLHGLGEPNFLSRSYDFLWWTLAGFGIGAARRPSADEGACVPYPKRLSRSLAVSERAVNDSAAARYD